MQSSDFRAKQFLPFDSLNGFRTLLKDAENGILESNIFLIILNMVIGLMLGIIMVSLFSNA